MTTTNVSKVRLVKEGLALVDSGPLFASISVSRFGEPMSDEALRGAYYALDILKQLVLYLPIIRQKTGQIMNKSYYPVVIQNMIAAVECLKDPQYTPLAAVAGATADMVADYLADSDATKIIVDNGGDIAIRLKNGDKTKVGLCLDLGNRAVEQYLEVDQNCGICTSGIGGRSFTLGIADAAVVLAENSVIADAAATYLGNNTNVNSIEIQRCLAEEIDPDTDIRGLSVTTHVGNLSKIEIETAVQNGELAANKLLGDGTIQGALISIKGNNVCLGKLAGVKNVPEIGYTR